MSGSGLSGIYSAILDFFPNQCQLLLELTHPGPPPGNQPPKVPGFIFLVNAVWPEVAAVIEERISAIFAPGNPVTFHKVCIQWTPLYSLPKPHVFVYLEITTLYYQWTNSVRILEGTRMRMQMCL